MPVRRTFSLLTVFLVLGCGDSSPTAPDDSVATSLLITPADLSLAMGATQQLQVALKDQRGRPMALPAGFTVSWSSSDTTRVVVEANGLARGVRPGSLTITATAGNLQTTAPASVLAAQIVLEEARAVSAQIGPEGGVLEAIGAAGARYRLEIPRFALNDTTTITLTPVASIQNTPRLTVLGAVKFSPNGLKLIGGATLTVDLPSAPPSGRLTGFTFSDDGQRLAPQLVAVSGTTLRITVSHFSGAGAANAEGSDAIPNPTESDPDVEAVLALLELGNDYSNVDAVEAIFRNWYTDGIKPDLIAAEAAAAANDVRWLDGIGEWLLWWRGIGHIGDQSGITAELTERLATLIQDGRERAAAVLFQQIAGWNGDCIRDKDWNHVRTIAVLQRMAEEWSLATTELMLDRQSVLDAVCVAVHIREISLASPLQPGVTEELVVRAGLAYGGEPAPDPPYSNDALRLTATIGGTTADGTFDAALQNGGWSKFLTPRGDADVAADIGVCIDSGEPLLRTICADADITRPVARLRVQPSPVTLNPGQTQQFAATFQGIPTVPVVWSATGGTITQSGLYTAGPTSGTYTVRAVTTGSPSVSAEAAVVIAPPPAITPVWNQSFTTGLVTRESADSAAFSGFAANISESDANRSGAASQTSSFNRDATTGYLTSIESTGNASVTVVYALDGAAAASAENLMQLIFDVEKQVDFIFTGSCQEGAFSVSLNKSAPPLLNPWPIGIDITKVEHEQGACANIQLTGTLPPGRYRLRVYHRFDVRLLFEETFKSMTGSYSMRLEFSER